MAVGPHVAIAAEALVHIGSVPITNSFFTTWVVMAILIAIAYAINNSLSLKPGKVQVAAEMLIGGLHDFFINLGGAHAKKFFPLIASLFFFIVFSNWFGLLPGVGTIGFFEKKETTVITEKSSTESSETAKIEPKKEESEKFVPLLRAPTADLNTTIALGLIAFAAIQFFGLRIGGLGYLKKFVDFRDPIFFFVGLLEIVSDISKVISFAFRLFGNIFAGEVLLAVMAFLMPFLLPLPFLGLEIFVGLVQGLVFAMLTSVFINLAVSHGHEESHAHES